MLRLQARLIPLCEYAHSTRYRHRACGGAAICGRAGQTRFVTLTWLKSRNLVAELAGTYAPEAGDPTPSAQSSVSGGLAGIASARSYRSLRYDSAAGPRLRPAWRPQVVSVGFLDWRLSTARPARRARIEGQADPQLPLRAPDYWFRLGRHLIVKSLSTFGYFSAITSCRWRFLSNFTRPRRDLGRSLLSP